MSEIAQKIRFLADSNGYGQVVVFDYGVWEEIPDLLESIDVLQEKAPVCQRSEAFR